MARVEPLAARLEGSNPAFKAAILDNADHDIAPTVYRDNAAWEWLFAQARLDQAADDPP